MTTERAHVWVSGRVQGVWFRDRCREAARAERVSGWVRNLVDGRVEAVFEGPASAVERMLAWCREGPPRAIVTDVEVRREQPIGESGFAIR
jgi:acylphosphatase